MLGGSAGQHKHTYIDNVQTEGEQSDIRGTSTQRYRISSNIEVKDIMDLVLCQLKLRTSRVFR